MTDQDIATVSTSLPKGEEEARSFVLHVVEGADKGQTLRVGPGEAPMRVGKNPTCALSLTDPEVSRCHASFEAEGALLRICDLGSTNGTWVDQVRVMDAFLAGGEFVRMGGTMLRVEASERETRSRVPESALLSFGAFLGVSPEIRRLHPLFEKLAQSHIPMVIEGETGTGKEVLAEAIHHVGPRKGGPFVVYDCTAVTPTLLESELFGHERGAYTGAVSSHEGVFEQADGGTLFIDEIGDLELSLQPKLLRAIERAEIRRVGGTGFIKCNVRVVAATRRNLDREVEAGRFRDDLLHRLAVGRVELPPLRDRTGEVAFLAAKFWKEAGGEGEIPEALVARWVRERFPGNVRELRNRVARQIALGGLSDFRSSMPPPPERKDLVEALLSENVKFPEARERILLDFEQRYVARAVEIHGSTAAAARELGIGQRYIQKLRAKGK